MVCSACSFLCLEVHARRSFPALLQGNMAFCKRLRLGDQTLHSGGCHLPAGVSQRPNRTVDVPAKGTGNLLQPCSCHSLQENQERFLRHVSLCNISTKVLSTGTKPSQRRLQTLLLDFSQGYDAVSSKAGRGDGGKLCLQKRQRFWQGNISS